MIWIKKVTKHRCLIAFIVSGFVYLVLHIFLSWIWKVSPFRSPEMSLMMILFSSNVYAEVLLVEFKKTHPDANDEINHNPYNAKQYYLKIWKKPYVQWSIAICLLVLILLGSVFLYLWYHKIDDHDILMIIFAIVFFLSLAVVVLILEFYRTLCFCIKTDQIFSKFG